MEIQTNNSRLAHHMLRKLDKAAEYSQILEKLSIRGDEETAWGCSAYPLSFICSTTGVEYDWEQIC